MYSILKVAVCLLFMGAAEGQKTCLTMSLNVAKHVTRISMMILRQWLTYADWELIRAHAGWPSLCLLSTPTQKDVKNSFMEVCMFFIYIFFQKEFWLAKVRSLLLKQCFNLLHNVLHTWKTCIFPLFQVIVRPTKVVNRADKNWTHF